MNFTEAFGKLGYAVGAPRTDWSSEKEDGVCITVWKKETRVREGLLHMDTKLHCDPVTEWGHKPGNKKRILHLQRALAEFDGFVDAVIILGTPGTGYGDAEPWISEKRQGSRWRVSNLDPTTGHFEASLTKARTLVRKNFREELHDRHPKNN